MREGDDPVIAILCSDIHLSATVPPCRSGEVDWYEAMARPLRELGMLSRPRHGDRLPIVCAGDIFDNWKAPPELIHFALHTLPDDMLCVPGQHDLPYHSYSDMHKSAYGVLKKAGKIVDMEPGKFYRLGKSNFCATGFPWGHPVEPNTQCDDMKVLAVVHAYIWTKKRSFPGAPEDANVLKWGERLRGFDAAVFGDNHKGFIANCGECSIINCGGFMRRKSDEGGAKPGVGLLHASGAITRHRFDTSFEKFVGSHAFDGVDPSFAAALGSTLGEFFEAMEELSSGDRIGFRDCVRQVLETRHVTDRTREVLLKAIGE